MIKIIKPNTLPYPGAKIYPDYEFKCTSFKIGATKKQVISQLQSWIPITRDNELYLVPFETSLESINTTDIECTELFKPALLEDLEFHAKKISRRYVIQDNNLTIYKYGNNSKN